MPTTLACVCVALGIGLVDIAAAATLVYAYGMVLPLGQLLPKSIFTLGAWSVPLSIFAAVRLAESMALAPPLNVGCVDPYFFLGESAPVGIEPQLPHAPARQSLN